MSSLGRVLVTGGAGYIGSHTVVEMLSAGFDLFVIDSFVNSSSGMTDNSFDKAIPHHCQPSWSRAETFFFLRFPGSYVLPFFASAHAESLRRVEKIAGQKVPFKQLDLLDLSAVEALFAEHKFAAVIHFAALKAVGESTQQPLRYYQNNLTGTINLLQVMALHGVRNLVFSSSATVYGDPVSLPINEQHPVGNCTNPYGKSKFFIEEVCADLAKSDKVVKPFLRILAAKQMSMPSFAHYLSALHCGVLWEQLFLKGLECYHLALFQPHRRPPLWHHWGGPERYSQQPASFCGAGSCWPSRAS